MRPKPTRRRFLATAAATAATGSWLAPAVRAAGPGRLRAGAAVADVTPPLGVSLKGPIGGNGVVKAIHDPLRARCLALDDGTTRFVICVCDVTVIWRRAWRGRSAWRPSESACRQARC